VWTVSDAEATRLLALDDPSFNDALTGHSARGLATRKCVLPVSHSHYAVNSCRSRCADACWWWATPRTWSILLAGQGVNLGLRDVSALGATIAAALEARSDWATSYRLARWARAARATMQLPRIPTMRSIALSATTGLRRRCCVVRC
jgi:2-octaprenyl-3-methyl-6-methoxy-1,4-benzoquinol hydroxylase